MEMLIPSRLSRRALLLGSGSAALAATVPLRSSAPSQSPFRKVTSAPDLVTVFTEGGSVALQREGSAWHGDGIDVTIAPGTDELPVTVRSGKHPLLRLHLRWRLAPPANLEYLGDQWERSYGDLAWRFLEPERVMP
jgi:alpha-galactosidase